MASILLIGPGAIGATLAAWLCQDDRHQVTVAARTAFESIETTTPNGVIRAKPRVITDVGQAQPVDWILVATKAYDSDAAAAWFPTATGPRTRLAVIQNGVEHIARFEKHFERARIVPVMIDLPAERIAPGTHGAARTARIVVPAGENGAAFLALFAHANFDAKQTDDFTTAVWKKLCLNSAGAPCRRTAEAGGYFASRGRRGAHAQYRAGMRGRGPSRRREARGFDPRRHRRRRPAGTARRRQLHGTPTAWLGGPWRSTPATASSSDWAASTASRRP